MTIMNTELYEALKEAGASDEKAKAASNVVEEQNRRFDAVDNHFLVMQKEIDHRFDKVDGKFDLLESNLKNDIERVETNLKNDIERVETSLKNDMDRMFYRLLASLGGLILFALTIVAKIAKVF